MSRVKLNSVLFEYMEEVTKKCYNYYEFIHELSKTVEYYYDSYYRISKEKEIERYFKGEGREETIEKLLKAYMFGYEEESDKYTIVLFELDGWEYVLWDLEDEYEIAPREEYIETEEFRKKFTMEEIVKNFPQLVPLAKKE